jgi:diacylglycerol kinase family enzyme
LADFVRGVPTTFRRICRMKAVALLHPDVTDRAVLRFQEICPELGVCSDFTSAEDASAMVIFGGEGTVHRHPPEVNRRKVLVLVVLCGRGNDFAKAVGIGNVRIALDTWKHVYRSGNNVLALDLGMIRRRGEEILFCCVAGAGLDAQNQCIG